MIIMETAVMHVNTDTGRNIRQSPKLGSMEHA